MGKGKAKGWRPPKPGSKTSTLLTGSADHCTGDTVASPVTLKEEGKEIPPGHPLYVDPDDPNANHDKGGKKGKGKGKAKDSAYWDSVYGFDDDDMGAKMPPPPLPQKAKAGGIPPARAIEQEHESMMADATSEIERRRAAMLEKEKSLELGDTDDVNDEDEQLKRRMAERAAKKKKQAEARAEFELQKKIEEEAAAAANEILDDAGLGFLPEDAYGDTEAGALPEGAYGDTEAGDLPEDAYGEGDVTEVGELPADAYDDIEDSGALPEDAYGEDVVDEEVPLEDADLGAALQAAGEEDEGLEDVGELPEDAYGGDDEVGEEELGEEVGEEVLEEEEEEVEEEEEEPDAKRRKTDDSGAIKLGLQGWAARVNGLAEGGEESLVKQCALFVRKRILRAHAEGNLHSHDWESEPMPTIDELTALDA